MRTILGAAVESLVASGVWPEAARAIPVTVDLPKAEGHGDAMTSFAMVASKSLGQSPRDIAYVLQGQIVTTTDDGLVIFDKIEVAGPGFLNMTLTPGFLARKLGQMLARGEAYALGEPGSGQRLNVEFVSVNPNGPITVGSGRGAAYGSALCNVLEAAGNTIHREYYINDGVNSEQMRQFAESVRILAALEADSSLRDFYQLILSLGLENPFTKVQQEFQDWHGLDSHHPKLFGSGTHEGYWHAKFGEFATTIGAERDNVRLVSKLLRPASRQLSGLYQSFAHPREIQSPAMFVMPLYKGDYVQAVAKQVFEMFEQGFENQISYAEGRLSDGSDLLLQRHMECNKRLQALIDEYGPEEAIARCETVDLKLLCETLMSDKQGEDLKAFGVTFDTWFSEQTLHEAGKVLVDVVAMEEQGVADRNPYRIVLKLARGGVIEGVEKEKQAQAEVVDDEHDDAPIGEVVTQTLWLRSTKFGDDMDRVLQRKDGRWTYITSDVTYHKEKFSRPENADKLITVLGPDHHGYIHRLRAVVSAMFIAQGMVGEVEDLAEFQGFDEKIYKDTHEKARCDAALKMATEKLQVQIFQIVRFLKEGKPAPMRKRDGNIYALIDLINEIGSTAKPNGTEEEKQLAGRDVARFFYLMRHHDTAMDFDLDLAVKQSDDNPVYYVQYAHARISSVLDKAKEAGIEPGGDLSLLTHPKERSLMIKIAELEEEIQQAAKDFGVNRFTTYSVELARLYHGFYDSCRVIQPDQPELSQARASLCLMARNALRAGFKLLGISAPARMSRDGLSV